MEKKAVSGIMLTLLLTSMLTLAFDIQQAKAGSFRSANGVTTTTYVEGNITVDTTWTVAGSPYIVTGNILVKKGVALTIEPGVVVKFNLAKAMQVDGQLIARGTETEPILFTSNHPSPAAGYWAGVKFTNSSIDASYDEAGNYLSGSVMQYCTIEYGGGGSPSLMIESASPLINNCVIKNNNSPGIYIANGSPKIVNSTITRNSGSEESSNIYGGGIYVSGDGAIISGNTITRNHIRASDPYRGFKAYGGGIYASGRIIIDSNNITFNSARGGATGDDAYGGGIYASGPVTINNNTITNNEANVYYGDAYGAGIYASGTVAINHNTIANNRASGYRGANALGGGIYAYGPITISGNTIHHNSVYDTIDRTAKGGGIYASGDGTIVSGNSIYGNSASVALDGYSRGYGGGIYTIGNGVNIAGNSIINNKALGPGGGVYASGEATIINENIVVGNSADLKSEFWREYSQGGGIYASDTVTISSNKIANNFAAYYGGGIYGGSSIVYNTIVNNLATAGGGGITGSATISNNTIISNTGNSIDVSGFENINYNNIYNGTPYEIYNAGGSDVDATNNWWGTINDALIQENIYDWFDDASRGVVDYIPYLSTSEINAPISPPTGLNATAEGLAISLTWSPNPETDLAGYRVYYDVDSGHPYNGTGANEGGSGIDVGNVTNYQLSGLTIGVTYYIVITAYDTSGDESWYSNEVSIIMPGIRVNSPNGGESWLVGSYQSIRWASSGVIGNVSIELSTDGGSTWKESLFASTTNDGVEGWRVMAYPGDQLRIRVISLDNPAISDMSDDDFSITTVSTTNTFPIGYCTWWAYERRAQLGMPVEWLNDMPQPRDAYKWIGFAEQAGVPTGVEPKVGAIAVWGATATNKYGHVAVVEWVSVGEEREQEDGEPSFGVSEMNYGSFIDPEEGITVNFRKVTYRTLTLPRPPEENFLGFIYAAIVPDFSITASPNSLTIQQGYSDTSVITISSIGGFDQPVELTVSGAPSGATATLDPEQVTPPQDDSTTSTLTVSVDTTATPGSYTLTVTGTNGTLTHNVDISLEITALPPPELVSARIDSYSVSPRNVTVGSNVTIGFSFTNTGNVSWTFGAGATLRKPDGTRIDFFKPVTVNPGGSGSAQWTYTIDMVGRWDTVFGVWKESTHPLENLLVQTGWVDEYITAIETEAPPPPVHASFIYSPESPKSGELVTFNASSSQGAIVSYQWNFTDGTTAEDEIVTHRFRGAQNEPKTYAVTLTVEDTNGATDSDTLSVTVNPLKKRVQLKPTYIDVRPFMEVTYNWVGTDEATGEDLYIISQIDTRFGGIAGATQFFIVRRTSPSPSWPKVIWHIPLPTEWRENTRTYTKFDDPSLWQRIWGTPCEPTKLTFPDGTFEGIEVTETSFMVIIATGAEISIISTYWDAGWARFDPNFPPSSLSQEQLKEVEDFKEILDLLYKLLAVIGSPGELRIYDSEGRVTGLVNGEIKEEIPGSAYTNGSIMILYPNETYRYEVGGIDNGTYKLLISSVENVDATTFIATEIPTLSNTVHQYTVDWAALSEGEEGVTVKVDSDGDGVFETEFTVDNELTQDEFMLQVPSAEAFPLWVLGAVAAVVIGVAVAATFLWRRRK